MKQKLLIFAIGIVLGAVIVSGATFWYSTLSKNNVCKAGKMMEDRQNGQMPGNDNPGKPNGNDFDMPNKDDSNGDNRPGDKNNSEKPPVKSDEDKQEKDTDNNDSKDESKDV